MPTVHTRVLLQVAPATSQANAYKRAALQVLALLVYLQNQLIADHTRASAHERTELQVPALREHVLEQVEPAASHANAPV